MCRWYVSQLSVVYSCQLLVIYRSTVRDILVNCPWYNSELSVEYQSCVNFCCYHAMGENVAVPVVITLSSEPKSTGK